MCGLRRGATFSAFPLHIPVKPKSMLHQLWWSRYAECAHSINIMLCFDSGNMWSQAWNNILDISTPYPEKEGVDVTLQMKKQVKYVRWLPVYGDQRCQRAFKLSAIFSVSTNYRYDNVHYSLMIKAEASYQTFILHFLMIQQTARKGHFYSVNANSSEFVFPLFRCSCRKASSSA
jgi:hypothetical protein